MTKKGISWLILWLVLLGLACNAGWPLTGSEPNNSTANSPIPAEPGPATPTKSNSPSVIIEGVVEGLATPVPTPIPTVTPQPAATVTTTSLPAESSNTLLADIGTSLAALDSYRLQLDFTFEGTAENGATITQQMNGEMAVVREPAASSVEATLSGLAGLPGVQNFNLVQTGEQIYMVLPGAGCLNGTADQLGLAQNPFAAIASPAAFLGDLSSVRLAGMGEPINGVTTNHFTFDQGAIPNAAGSFQSLDGHLYLAQDGNYPVRLTLDGNGVLNLGRLGGAQEGITHLQLDILDANEPLNIAPPTGC